MSLLLFSHNFCFQKVHFLCSAAYPYDIPPLSHPPILGDSYWEPTTEGYKKSDGQLVLTSGALIKDPSTLTVEENEERFPKDICTECSERFAIRSCKECGDNYCTPCFKSSHGAGTRRNHSYTMIGPVDCTECEMQLAVRWCVTCDESHCDMCWRKLHSKSKRRFHPFCKVYPGGRIGIKMTTIDGEEVQLGNNYSFSLSVSLVHTSHH